MPDVDIVCLANSRKLSGRCVAGLRLDGGGWLRPVSGPEFSGTLSVVDYLLDDDSEAALLDILRISVIEAAPEPHQPENWLIAPSRWRLVERHALSAALPLLQSALIPGPGLLGGHTDRIPYAAFKDRPARASLALAEPSAVAWRISAGFRGNRQARARFTLGGSFYDLPITDPVFEQRVEGLQPGQHPRAAAGIAPGDRVLFTVSLGEPLASTQECFKLVAAVIILPADSWTTRRPS